MAGVFEQNPRSMVCYCAKCYQMIRALTWLMLGVLILLVGTLVGLADAGKCREFSLWVAHYPWADKAGHFVLVGALAFFANAALKGGQVKLGTFTFLKGSLFVLVPTVLEEFSQLFFRSRTFDLLDLVADGLGILVGGWFAVLLLRQTKVCHPRVKTAPRQGAIGETR